MIVCPRCAVLHSSVHQACPQCGVVPAQVDGFRAWSPQSCEASSGFRSEYFAPLAAYEAKNFWFLARNRLIVWALETYCSPFESYLEIGCGTGFVLAEVARVFSHARVTGSEIFTKGLTFAAARVPRAHLIQMDACDCPYLDEFDVASAFDVIEHIDDDEVALRNLFRAVKAGGYVLITVPQHRWLWSATDSYACHRRRYEADELHAKVRRAGFEILRSTSFVSLLLPVMLVSRRSAKQVDPLAEFKNNAKLNEVLKAILACERRLITLGVNFPVGGSRLVVLKKPAPDRHCSISGTIRASV
jgi:SAM-dependent methyltransferase